MNAMMEQDRQVTEVIAEQGARLRNFIRRRVPSDADADELLQDVFFELVRAHRLLLPIDHAAAWLYQVARNRITDWFRKKTPERFADAVYADEDGEQAGYEDLLPSPDAGPEALYLRRLLLDEMRAAIEELPAEQRAVFVAHEFDGRSFKELAAETGVSVNTLLARKHYAVLALRRRLQRAHDEFLKK